MPLDIKKVVLGAFLVPLWNGGNFVQGLAVPLFTLIALSLGWAYAYEYIAQPLNWLLLLVYFALFVLFAVKCHRLVLLGSRSISMRWSHRETRFLLFMIAVYAFAAIIAYLILMLILNLWTSAFGVSHDAWISWVTALIKIPFFYIFGRLCLVFPATALDKQVDFKWSWQITRNNGWRLFLIVGVLPWALSEAVSLLYLHDPNVFTFIFFTVLATLLFIVEITAVSLSYQQLTKNEVNIEAHGLNG